ncbi:unnamed protein product [Trichobilharzia regenti]|nr:unnamed protein product [Trichobilharzia regenti]
MHGLPMKALEHACRSKLWGHAFTLAHRMGPPIFAKVMDRFLNNAVPISDPILTLYQLTAGDMPQVINTAAYGKGKYIWILYMLLGIYSLVFLLSIPCTFMYLVQGYITIYMTM